MLCTSRDPKLQTEVIQLNLGIVAKAKIKAVKYSIDLEANPMKIKLKITFFCCSTLSLEAMHAYHPVP